MLMKCLLDGEAPRFEVVMARLWEDVRENFESKILKGILHA